MSGFRKDVTTSANAAIMTAGVEVAALVAAGVVQTVADAVKAGKSIAAGYIEVATPIVAADNALFAEVEGQTGKPLDRAQAKPASGDPGDTVFNGGKFKGKSIREVYEMGAEEAKDSHGHTFGAGDTYITNYVATDKNTNATTREAAKAFLAAA